MGGGGITTLDRSCQLDIAVRRTVVLQGKGRGRSPSVVESIYTESPDSGSNLNFAAPKTIDRPSEDALGFGDREELAPFLALCEFGAAASLATDQPTSAPASAATPPAETDKADAPVLPRDKINSVVIIDGDRGTATGFVARVHDLPFVVTNLHVLGDNKTLTVKTLQGKALAFGAVAGAIGADIAILRIVNPDAGPVPLPLAADVLAATKIGDQVIVSSATAWAAAVATQVTGKVLGVGPDRIEIDAPFPSRVTAAVPVFDATTGEVLGIAAYTETIKLDAAQLEGKYLKAARIRPSRNAGSPSGWIRWPNGRRSIKDGRRGWSRADEARDRFPMVRQFARPPGVLRRQAGSTPAASPACAR